MNDELRQRYADVVNVTERRTRAALRIPGPFLSRSRGESKGEAQARHMRRLGFSDDHIRRYLDDTEAGDAGDAG